MSSKESLPHEEFIKNAILSCKESHIGLAVRGHDMALWFKTTDIGIEGGHVTAKNGWGSDGECTHLYVPAKEITAVMQADAPQYLRPHANPHANRAPSGTPPVISIHRWLRRLLRLE